MPGVRVGAATRDDERHRPHQNRSCQHAFPHVWSSLTWPAATPEMGACSSGPRGRDANVSPNIRVQRKHHEITNRVPVRAPLRALGPPGSAKGAPSGRIVSLNIQRPQGLSSRRPHTPLGHDESAVRQWRAAAGTASSRRLPCPPVGEKQDAALARVGTQDVAGDDLTGNGVPAPPGPSALAAWLPHLVE